MNYYLLHIYIMPIIHNVIRALNCLFDIPFKILSYVRCLQLQFIIIEYIIVIIMWEVRKYYRA